MNIENKNINEYIKILAASAGLSLAAVARRVGDSPQQLAQRMKKGKMQADFDYLQNIASVCGYDLKIDFIKKD
jgi:transcriptional regulator with XRE-family HTH domain